MTPGMQATFRSDAELIEDGQGGLRLQRRAWPRALSIGVALLSIALVAIDLRVAHPGVAAAQAVLAVVFVALLVRAEVDDFRYRDGVAVRRWLTLRGVQHTRLWAKSISRVGVERAEDRARAWIETIEGEQIALLEGEAEAIDRAAKRLAELVKRSAREQFGQLVH